MSVAGCQVSAGGRWGRISQPALQNLELIFASGCDNDGCIDASFIDSIRPLSIEAVADRLDGCSFFHISVRFANSAGDNDGCIDASFIDSIRPLSIEAVGWMDVLFFYISVRFAGNADPHKRLANC